MINNTKANTIKNVISTSNHMLKREIWDKFQNINEVNFPKISRVNVIPGKSHVTSSQRTHKGKNYTKNYQSISTNLTNITT